MTDNRQMKYKIAEVCISADGKTFWVSYCGMYPDQGGDTFRWGSIGCSDLEGALALLKHGLEKDLTLIQQRVKEKASQ